MQIRRTNHLSSNSPPLIHRRARITTSTAPTADGNSSSPFIGSIFIIIVIGAFWLDGNKDI